jgi:hypothetical protein
MKLPDFKTLAAFNSLKEKMGVPKNVYGDLYVELAPGRLSLSELSELSSAAGLDVSLDEIVVLPDGTLGYKGQRVVVYIRDKSDYSAGFSEPRFHIGNCATLTQMRHNNRFGRYVATNDTSGRFDVNIINHGRTRSTSRYLRVCQNCLEFLKVGNFSLSDSPLAREAAVVSFSLVQFFAKYPRSFHAEIPRYDAQTAPINDYSSGFSEVSAQFRAQSSWRCEEPSCGVDLSEPRNRKYLHTHHANGEKYDNSLQNLRALCVYCHANTAMHQHLKSSRDYKDFLSIRLRLLSRR